ncbi:hypothetical protein IEQ34_020736 [Dendrobium chrysotoxum]|uniref:Uncharacterized protein n=1 Tax=Dendrobium chrysotoxum TaxID=161865 RepID=A0AAV7FKP6_DENCH|nr:hypothetical protein IEQ34_020736 [Dendrobium chrysotoxum]
MWIMRPLLAPALCCAECCSSIPVIDLVNHNISGENVNAVVENVAVVGPVENYIPTVTPVSPIEVMVNGEIGVDGALAMENSNGNTEVATLGQETGYLSSVVLSVTHSSGINEGVTEVSEPNPCLVNLVASPNASPDSNVVVGDENVSPVGGLLPIESGEVVLDSPARFSDSFPDGVEPKAKNVNVPLTDMPISVISNDALSAHLTCNSGDHEMMHGDWLDDGNSSASGDETNENDLDSQDSFDLNIIQVAADDFF